MIQSKDIGNYIVYTDGKVWSKRKLIWLSSYKNHRGYSIVKIDGKQIRLHRLVAECFLSNPLNHPEVDHLNNNKEANHIENLQWISAFDNRSKAHKDGLIPYCYGTANGRSKQNRIKFANLLNNI
jgi:hypothetical protein